MSLPETGPSQPDTNETIPTVAELAARISLQRSWSAESMIYRLMSDLGAQKNLQIGWLRDEDDLYGPDADGLIANYKAIFAEAPYFEAFSDEDVRDAFAKMLNGDGFVFTAKRPSFSDEVCAFVGSFPLINKPEVADLVAPYTDPQKACYFAEDAVVAPLRREGISRTMKTLLLSANSLKGYETMVLRTSIDSFSQAAAVRQLGGMQIPNLTQDVPSARLDGSVTTDTRVFFTFDLTGAGGRA